MNSFDFMVNGQDRQARLETNNDGLTVTVDNKEIKLNRISGRKFRAVTSSGPVVVTVARAKRVIYVDVDGDVIEIQESSEDDFAGSSGEHTAEKDKAYAPMPGKLVKIMVAIGDTVAERQTLAVVEAMKMENPIQAKAGGTVKAVNFAEGDQVDTEHAIVELDLT